MDEETFINTLNEALTTFGPTLWTGFISLVITWFILTIIKDFVVDLVLYLRARVSDIGYGQRLFYNDKLYIVKQITFKHIIMYDNIKVIRMPISTFLESVLEFPQPKYEDFAEKESTARKGKLDTFDFSTMDVAGSMDDSED